MTPNANLFEPERKKRAHSKTHHKDAEAILRVLKDLWKMQQRGNLKGASKLLTKHNVSRLPIDIYLGFIEGKSYDDLTLDYANGVKPLLNKAKKERYGKQEPQAQTIEGTKEPLTSEETPTTIDWEQRRYEIAKDVAVKLYCAYKEGGNDDYFEILMDAVRDCDEYTTEEEVICGSSVYFANTLIKWLKDTQQL